jgi:hypothetical protein
MAAMLATQTALPLLQKYIQVKNHGRVTQKIADRATAAGREGGELVTVPITSRAAPPSAIRMRRNRFSYGWGSQSAQMT